MAAAMQQVLSGPGCQMHALACGMLPVGQPESQCQQHSTWRPRCLSTSDKTRHNECQKCAYSHLPRQQGKCNAGRQSGTCTCQSGLTCNEAVEFAIPLGIVLCHQPPELPLQLVLFHELMHLQHKSVVSLSCWRWPASLLAHMLVMTGCRHGSCSVLQADGAPSVECCCQADCTSSSGLAPLVQHIV